MDAEDEEPGAVSDVGVLRVFSTEVVSITLDVDSSTIESVTKRWSEEQETMAAAVVEADTKDFSSIKYYAGTDISFHKSDQDRAVASMVVMDRATHKVAAEISILCNTNIPYISGYLAYREAPILSALLEVLKQECPQFTPGLIICDGNGIWHSRFCGVATHFSLMTGIPCIGVAKKFMAVSTLSRDHVVAAISPEKGSMLDFEVDGRVIGSVFNSTGSVARAMYISIGNGISLETAKQFVREVSIYRVVEPVRKADLLSRKILRELDY